jgi:hypothetical protein
MLQNFLGNPHTYTIFYGNGSINHHLATQNSLYHMSSYDGRVC